MNINNNIINQEEANQSRNDTKGSEKKVLGLDALPPEIRNSDVLTENDLALLAAVESIPVYPFHYLPAITEYMARPQRHAYAQEVLRKGRIAEAWAILRYHELKMQEVNQ